MSSESVTKEEVVSESASVVENALNADEKVSNNSGNNSVDIHERKVLDEEFRRAVEKMSSGIATIPNDWNDLTVRAQRNWVYNQLKNHWTNVPESLLALLVGSAINVDCNRVSVAVPEWLDREKYERGQRFAMDHYAGISMAEVLSLFTLFSFEHGLKPLFIVTGKARDSFASFKRHLSTGRCIKNWYSSNVWFEGTEAYKDMRMIRGMHAEGLNQTEMATNTQFGFMGLVILYPERFGIHGATDQDLDAYCHLWRGLGYLLGIEDEFNFCNGTLEEVKQRARDFLECWVKPNLRDITPEWEHLIKSVMEGTKYYSPIVSYEHTLLYLADMINIPVPRLRSSLSYSTWIRFYIMEFLFNATAQIPGSMPGMDRAIKMRI